MPIAQGALGRTIGRRDALSEPSPIHQRSQEGGVGYTGSRFGAPAPFRRGRPIRSTVLDSTLQAGISGITRDGVTGVPVGACTVDLFLASSDLYMATTISDGGGNYRFDNPGSGPFYVRAYLPGFPNTFGTTDETLIAI